MDAATAERLITSTRQILGCKAWEEWFIPTIKARQEIIRKELTTDLPKKKTASLREEYRVLEDLCHWPSRHLNQATEVLKELKGEDAVD